MSPHDDHSESRQGAESGARLRSLVVEPPTSLAKYLRDAGYEVELIARRDDGEELTPYDVDSVLRCVAAYAKEHPTPAASAAAVDLRKGWELIDPATGRVRRT